MKHPTEQNKSLLVELVNAGVTLVIHLLFSFLANERRNVMGIFTWNRSCCHLPSFKPNLTVTKLLIYNYYTNKNFSALEMILLTTNIQHPQQFTSFYTLPTSIFLIFLGSRSSTVNILLAAYVSNSLFPFFFSK